MRDGVTARTAPPSTAVPPPRRYPLTSMTSCSVPVVLFRTLNAPPLLRGTIARSDVARPATTLRFTVAGRVGPACHTVTVPLCVGDSALTVSTAADAPDAGMPA